MINTPSQEQLNNLPQMYETQHSNLENKIVHLHFSLDRSHWWAMEWDGHDTFFGYVLLNGWMQDAELGYFTLSWLCTLNLAGWMHVENDPTWIIRPAKEVDLIIKTLQFKSMARQRSQHAV